MNTRLPGLLIRAERLRRNWSQSGLCRGICAVSYLSKIEQGKAEAAKDVLRLLFSRLELHWYDDPETLRRVGSAVEAGYDAAFSEDERGITEFLSALESEKEVFENGPYMMDTLLLQGWFTHKTPSFAAECESMLDDRQRTLLYALQERHDDILRFNPSAFAYLLSGCSAAGAGNHPVALELLQRGYDLAAREGRVYIMIQCRSLMGNCYSILKDIEHMQEHYRATERLARAVNHTGILETLRYNEASTLLEIGRVDPAYAYFSALEKPEAMALHKLAICCEKLGRREEALDALDRAGKMPVEFPDREMVRRMCDLVRFRLEHPDYLQKQEYGEMLLSCFRDMRRDLPCGYADFHLPWVLEWHRAARQYKQALDLLQSFQGNSN